MIILKDFKTFDHSIMNSQYNIDFNNYHRPPNRYILLSLHEHPHQDILAKRKQYEYRRQFVYTPVNAFIYVSGRIHGICAYAEFGDPIIGSIEKIITVNKSDVRPNEEGIRRYFKSSSNCFAIPIIKYKELPNQPLASLRKNFHPFTPPQSYIFLERKPELLHYLLSLLDL
jgi:predicted transcriptional regulator